MYQEQIDKLQFIITNWKLIQSKPSLAEKRFYETFNCKMDIVTGLCPNCGLDFLDIDIIEPIFKSFSKFSGDSYFPLGEKEYNMFNNFADNPDRLELAIHTINKLKELQYKR